MNATASLYPHQRVSQNFINIEIKGTSYELIRILIKNDKEESVASLSEELHSGKNIISVDLSSLIKGNYSIVITNIHGHIRLIENIKL